MSNIKKIVTDKKRNYYVKDDSKDYHCKDGMIRKEDLKVGTAKSNKDKEFYVFNASKVDQFKNLKRAAQVMDPKDLGIILSNTLVDKDSIVFDCGSGTGAAACFFASYVKKVYSFDVREDHKKTLEENAKNLGLKNISTSIKNIYEDDLDVKDKCNLFVLDVPEPEKAVFNVDKNLEIGGFLVAYNPCITQNNRLVDSLPDNFMHVKTIEIIEREWHAEGKKVRPQTKEFSHTGFLTFARKIGK
ncbi:hypothetical protein C0585_05595 [Candidatus Woesearchaeota archaeon]|nr:MAG: hypothetical protein C0585_05595 [Candidatus Woesearchaeota archaeon]